MTNETDEPDDQRHDDEAVDESSETVGEAERFDDEVRRPVEDFLDLQGRLARAADNPAIRRAADEAAKILQSHINPMMDQLSDVYRLNVDIESLVGPSNETMNRIRDSIQAVQASLPDYSSFLPRLELGQEILAAVRSVDTQSFIDAYMRCCPPNWSDDQKNDYVDPLSDLAEAGYPTAWVPRSSVLQELLDAPEVDRAAVFERNRDEVLQDCVAVLREVTSPELAELVTLLGKALDAAVDGYLEPSQSLAASIVDTTLRKVVPPTKYRYYAKVKDECPRTGSDVAVGTS
ncbi:hypothetical protein [Pseudonocardia sp. WMMC193]|uniref:hypothetical protein n=1 Tax=Pseudonocardia sp. WMMC193 TaxID=2911965 RepID=UPI001F3F1320|nr:hypothetical protein [Pseudonocardia sp. WMMC193]MCF7547175.1 hypothetical protein [Pseudonocardia sp. WMMC193]